MINKEKEENEPNFGNDPRKESPSFKLKPRKQSENEDNFETVKLTQQ
jgi:hypothetical protein